MPEETVLNVANGSRTRAREHFPPPPLHVLHREWEEHEASHQSDDPLLVPSEQEDVLLNAVRECIPPQALREVTTQETRVTVEKRTTRNQLPFRPYEKIQCVSSASEASKKWDAI